MSASEQHVTVGPLPAPSYHAFVDDTPVWDDGDGESEWAVGLNADGTVGAKVYTADGKVTNPRALAEAILAAENVAAS